MRNTKDSRPSKHTRRRLAELHTALLMAHLGERAFSLKDFADFQPDEIAVMTSFFNARFRMYLYTTYPVSFNRPRPVNNRIPVEPTSPWQDNAIRALEERAEPSVQ